MTKTTFIIAVQIKIIWPMESYHFYCFFSKLRDLAIIWLRRIFDFKLAMLQFYLRNHFKRYKNLQAFMRVSTWLVSTWSAQKLNLRFKPFLIQSAFVRLVKVYAVGSLLIEEIFENTEFEIGNDSFWRLCVLEDMLVRFQRSQLWLKVTLFKDTAINSTKQLYVFQPVYL